MRDDDGDAAALGEKPPVFTGVAARFAAGITCIVASPAAEEEASTMAAVAAPPAPSGGRAGCINVVDPSEVPLMSNEVCSVPDGSAIMA